MNKTMKKALSLVLMIIMVLSSVPMSGFALNLYCESNGHSWGTYTVTETATCSKTGKEVAECTRLGCDAKNTRTIVEDPTKHNEITMPREEATCDGIGNEAGVVCGDCNAVISGYGKIPAKGHVSEKLPAKAATCEEDGYTAGTKCKNCPAILTGGDKIEKLGHKWTTYTQSAPDCKTGTPGKKVDICQTCSKLSTEQNIEAKHNFGVWTTTVEATCSTEGKKVRRCTITGCNRADSVEEVIIPKLGHTEVAVSYKAATCTEAGVTAGKKCRVCDTIIEGAVVIPATGHTTVNVAGKPATCDTKGTSDSSYCSACGFVISEAKVIAELGHKMVKDTAKSKEATCTATGLYVEKCTNTGCAYTTSEVLPIIHEANWVTITQVTCTTDGKRRGTCTKCGMDVTETIKATGHTVANDASWKTTKYPTCTEAGTKTAKCDVCKKDATKTVPATGHNIVVKTAKVEPTCSKEGATESKYCSICKVETVKSEPIAKVAHTFGDWTVKTAPTCAAVGVEEATCKVCGAKETRVADRLPHTEKEIPAVPATCTTAGSTAGLECTKCNAKIKEVTTIDALGHDFVLDAEASYEATCTTPGKEKGKCSRCDEIKDKVIDAKGHTEEVITGSPADCETSGTSDGKKCTVCKEILVEQTPIQALGHDLIVDTANSTPATCTTPGKDVLICTRCKYTENKDTQALAHAFGEWIETKPASCAESGLRTRTCSNCKTVEDETIPSFDGHDMVILPGEEATCTTPGKTTGSYCERCETVFEVQTEIQPKGHTLGDTPELKPATIEEDGGFGYICAECKEAVNAQRIAKIDKDSIKLSTTTYYYNGKTRTPSVIVKDADGNELVKGEDFDVIYSAGRKNPGKYDAQITFKGNYEGEMTLTFSINPVKTAKVSYTNYGDYILISWDKVVGATGYTVYIYKDSANGTTRKAIKTLTGTSYKLTKDYSGKALGLDENYRIGIVSRTRTEDGTILMSLNPTIKVVTRKLVRPTLTVTSTTGKANLKWTNVANETGYEVVYATSKDGTYKKLTTTKANVAAFTKSLTRGGTFYFKVRAYKTVGSETYYSNYSAVKSIKIK